MSRKYHAPMTWGQQLNRCYSKGKAAYQEGIEPVCPYGEGGGGRDGLQEQRRERWWAGWKAARDEADGEEFID